MADHAEHGHGRHVLRGDHWSRVGPGAELRHVAPHVQRQVQAGRGVHGVAEVSARHAQPNHRVLRAQVPKSLDLYIYFFAF